MIRQSKHLPSLAEGDLSITGTAEVTADSCGFSEFAQLIPVVVSSSAPDSPIVTVSYSKNKKVATISVWKPTAAGNTALIASTSAVNVSFIAMGA